MDPTDIAHEDWQLATHHFRQGDDASAEKICRDLIEELPSHVGATHLLGVICGKTGRLSEAIQHLQRAAQLEPSSSEILAHLSYALSLAGALARALKGFARVRELNPGNVDAVGMIGSLSLQLGRYQEAAEALMEAGDLRPRSPEVQMLKGQALLRIGRPAEAESAFRRALELRPTFSEAAAFLADSLAAQGRTDEAEREYRAGLGKGPRFHAGLIRLLDARGRRDEAMAVARDSMDSAAPCGAAVRMIAAERAAAGNYSEAAQAIEQVLPQLSQDTIDMGAAMFDMARHKFAGGDAPGAMKTALQAREALAPQGRPKAARGKHYLRMLERLAQWPSERDRASWPTRAEGGRVGAVVGVMGARPDLLASALREIEVFAVTDGRSTIVGLGGEIPGQPLGSTVYPEMMSALGEEEIRRVRETYLEQVGQTPGKTTIDAHAHNVEHLAALSRVMPGYRAVAVVRDPSDALAEAMLEPTVEDESALVLTSIADMAVGILGQCRALKRAMEVPGLSVLVVDADNLDGDTEAVLTRIVAHLGGGEVPAEQLRRALARYRAEAAGRLSAGCGAAFAELFAPVRGMLDAAASLGLAEHR